ncbi:proliferating cell nuclear antigen (pcna) [Methanothermobacter wolfeii]|uniref:DNA polymerase sliding clamp n=1 Tax=Methanothermobacter wolfeii TaxID=145261 RepID=A0A9E7RSV1_METWO|nr:MULTISPECIES: proliferating cell nuclear antigen (pcna) [Methanothermobacter]NLM02026.1 proliferating cell nuclear antigen (pcna) [Methanothermobacter wolfeii]QHN07019.1 proliferating cell nuclear antigen (pcna) [Methanothermobacter sp. THM-1]UXH31616.1 proliferating cell nuclear antigen (pcna) [Methanothermobacter wolfeii]SCM58545.1 DNA polymerase sliding clamp {ECO:0000255/HAMAP-Rule:MF_00317} [Methanothermobacter wolfeii]
MFKAELNDPNILRTSFDAISSIVDEVQIQTSAEGMRLDALDRSHITYVHLELKADLFDEYVCDEPEKINVDTEELMKVLKRAKANDRLLLSLDEGNLIVQFEGEAVRTFKIRLIDIEYETPSPPEIEYENEFEVPFQLLKDSIADIDIFSDKITFRVDEDRFIASAEGEFGDAQIEYLHGEKINNPARSVYSLDKIKEMLKADKFSETAIINLGNDMPLKLTLKMPSNEGELSFLLAPRIEAEE